MNGQAASAIADTAIDRYQPAPPGDALLGVPDPSVDGNAELDAGARFSYARSPLRLKTASGSDPIVTYQLVAHALLAAELARRFELLLDAPFVLGQNGPADKRFESPSGAAVGDLRLDARSALVDAHGNWPAGALELELQLPTGNGDFASYPSARYGASVVVGADLDDWLWRARFGVRYRRDQTEGAGIFGSEAHASVGIGRSWQRALFGVEIWSASGLESGPGFLSRETSQLEAIFSAKYRFGPFTALIAGGPGLTRGVGTPAYRVIVGVEIAHELAPIRRSSLADRDGDGVPDRDDRCPDLVGASNGCPADSDGDGIFDRDDACPHVRGEKSSDPKQHGCPVERGNGSTPQAHFVGASIVIREQIHFATGKDQLLAESFGVLGEVAKLLSAHPEIARVSVDGHTDDVGDDAENLRLSRRRALAVVRWLVEHGIDERRLEARGFGARQRLVDEKTEQGRTKNRRVEIRIIRQTELGRRGWKDGAADD